VKDAEPMFGVKPVMRFSNMLRLPLATQALPC
jgi:hypothetical protein